MFQIPEILRIPSNTFVNFRPEGAHFGTKPAVLEWTFDQRIRLIALNGNTGLPERTVFTIAITDITQLNERVDGFILSIGPAKHRIYFHTRLRSARLWLKSAVGLKNSQPARWQESPWVLAFRIAGVPQAMHRRALARSARRYDALSALPTAPRRPQAL